MKTAQPETVAASRVNPGETLRKAREARGWAVADVAAQLNLTSQRLNEIEQGAFEKVPGLTFARGYVRAYAKLLGLDQALLVQEFDAYTGCSAIESNVHSLERIEEPRNLSQRVLKVVSFVVLVGLAGASFYWWKDQAERREETISSASIEHVEVDGADGTTQIHPLDEPEDQAVEAAAQELTEQVLPLPVESSDESASADQPTDVQMQNDSSTATASTETAQTPTAPVVSGVATAEPALEQAAAPLSVAPGEALLELAFTADCWIQVKDATGKILHSALKRKGDTYQVAGKAPLELRLGYARGASVRLNGAEVDVAPFISGETARLNLGGQ